jgi:hypothetical protein
MKLVFGFENTPYSARYSRASPLPAYVKKRRPRALSPTQQAYGQGKTVGQVAEELEKKYGITEKFYELEENYIVDNFEESFANTTAIGIMGGSWDVAWDPIKLEGRFRRSLSSRRFDGLIPGVPTKAAQRGVSHLRQNPYAARGSRPSFIDTSLYQRSFKAWLEN